jgi:molybdenum cofactor guanylyltransferase
MPGTGAAPAGVGGFVLAGGQSSRMGTNKALLEIAGKPLVQRAVWKLRSVCTDVRILSSDPALASFAPLQQDLHPGCGPISGLEAALAYSAFDWNVFLPVDMPFLPSALISDLVGRCCSPGQDRGVRIGLFRVEGRPQPGFCVLHRAVLPFLTQAIQQHEHKLMRVFEEAGRALGERHGVSLETALLCLPLEAHVAGGLPVSEGGWSVADSFSASDVQPQAQHLWFSNLNTPEDFAEAQRYTDALKA